MITSIEQLEQKIEFYSEEGKNLILKAAEKSRELHEGQFRESGEPYFVHPLQVAEILIDIRLDAATIIAALLHDVLEDTEMTRVELRDEFGKEVEQLVNGVTKIASVKAKNRSTQQSETIRKMLLAMVKDLRVILIKLADKLHNMRTLEHKTADRRKAIAQECLDLYAPLAGRLGIAWLKSEFEDLSFKNLNRDEYNQIKAAVAQKRGERSDYLDRVAKKIEEASAAEGLDVEVDARAKHFYSIYEKMKKRNKSIEEVYDLLGMRILCNSSTECYTVLGLVHRLWPPIEGRFKDYIAMPKSNRYQSLHTTVLAFGGRMLEIQIRTHDMHQTAEYGIAAHWLYKSGMSPDNIGREELVIINRLKSMNALHITSNEFLEEIKGEILKDYIYVFTPQGDAIQLPRGATAIDFAYHIHTEIGDHISGAKADGQIIPLKNELKNTQVIEILTSPNAHPHLNWLRYVRTSRARGKIRHWLNKHEDNLFIDKSIVARKRPAPTEASPERKGKDEDAEGVPQQTLQPPDKVGVKIGDERNMMIRFAQCCNPRTGDDIVGYISRGRGIIVHKRGCRNLEFIEDYNERAVEVEWETVSPKATRRFRVVARKTSDLFSEIEGAVRKHQGHLIEGRIDENERGQLEAHFTMELESKDDFRKVMKNIRTVPAVVSIAES
jgi:GTP diphosphokinase / guanosine-3',5'-bis(diphosphate) 3'-diphosphatase